MNEMIKYLVVDVDGTMTDAGIYYDEQGNELKKFCTRDAAGFFAAHFVGIKIVIITGRECAATTRRMKEMKVDYIFQNIKDKKNFLMEFMATHCITKKEIGYIGDDLNDLSSMHLCGFVACPADSCKEVRSVASYVSTVSGGYGVVRDVIETYLEKHSLWKTVISNIYNVGI